MLRTIKPCLLTFVLLALSMGLRAQEVLFETNGPHMVAVGEPFRIEFALNAKPEEVTPPDLVAAGFDVLAGPSTSQGQSVSIVNGKTSVTVNVAYTYIIVAPTAGMVTIPPAKARVDGKEYTTKPLPIEVVAEEGAADAGAGGAAAPQTARPGQSGAASSSISADDIFVRVSVNRNKVYKGQPVRAIFKIYTRGVNLGGVDKVTFPAFNGFWAQDINVDGQQWQRETYNGKVYNSRVIKETLLYPQQSGSLYIEQFSLTAILQIITQAAPRGSLFDDFFGGGPQVQEVRRELNAAPVQINVEEFPAGAPASFAGAVGQFQLSGSLSGNTLAANSSNTYQLKLSGTGNLPLIPAPKLTLPTSFEQYNMKTTESLNQTPLGIAGYRQFEYPFIPRAEGNYEIPSIEFTYFDPEKRQYVTLSTSAMPLTILADSTSSAGVGATGLVSGISKEELKILDKDIRFIRTDNPQLSRRGVFWFGGPAYWLVLVALAAFAVVAYLYLKKTLKERKNITLVRNKKANRVALQRFKSALAHMNAGAERPFYEETLRALWGYMSDKLNIPVADLTKDNIRGKLERRNIAPEQAERFIRLISDCEQAQYSPSAPGQMNEIYNAAVKMLSRFESVIKR